MLSDLRRLVLVGLLALFAGPARSMPTAEGDGGSEQANSSTPDELAVMRRMWPGWDSRPPEDQQRKLIFYRQWQGQQQGGGDPKEFIREEQNMDGRWGRPCPLGAPGCRTDPDNPPEGEGGPKAVIPTPRPQEPPKPPNPDPSFQQEVWPQLPPEQQELARRIIERLNRCGVQCVVDMLGGRREPENGMLRDVLSKLGPFLSKPQDGGAPSKPFSLPESFWKQQAQRDPKDPQPHSAIGEKRLADGDNAGARSSYDKAIALGGHGAENFLGRGLASERLGDHHSAHQDAFRALGLEPGNKNAQALLHLTAGRIPGLRLDPKAMRAGAPEWDAAQATAGPGPAAPASRQPRASPASQGVNPIAASGQWTQESLRAFRLGDFRSALKAADAAVNHNARNLQALNLRAMAKDRLGDKKGAVADATEGLRLKPDDTTLLNTRAWAENGIAAYEQALEDGRQVVGLDPGNAFGHLNVGRAEGGLGRRPEMLEALRKAAGLDGRFGPTLEAALALPAKSDTELLFRGALPSTAEAPPRSRPKRFLMLMALSVLGGVLIAAGLLHVLSGGSRKSLTQLWRGKVGAALGAAGGAADDALPGRFWEYYSLKRKLGSGGMGVVYEAVDQSLGRRVAVKQMRGEVRDDPEVRGQFLKEARVVAALQHPGIAGIYSIIEDGAELYMVFEFVEGKTLEALLAERGRLPLEEAAALMRGACAAVQHAHERGVVHRDLKPANIMVTPQGEAKVTDFGIARQVPDSKTVVLTENLCGTPPYMAPEAEQGEVCKESDIYALGVCLYELVTGRAPFGGPPAAMHVAKLSANYDPATRQVPALPRSLDKVIGRALATTPAARYSSPAAFYADLERLLTRT